MTKLTGVVVYHGPSLLNRQQIVAIATFHSENSKTGNMVQLWILPAKKNPLRAIHDNDNGGPCGNCALQGIVAWAKAKGLSVNQGGRKPKNADLHMEDRVCYVNLGQAPESIWKAWKRGKYPELRPEHRPLFADRELRGGAYGDPAGIPVGILRKLVHWSAGHTAYTHQMADIGSRRNSVANLCMVSCDNLQQDRYWKEQGYRTFTVLGPNDTPPVESVECPYYTRGVQCQQCMLCAGTSKQAKSVYARAHGKVGLNLPIVQKILARQS